MQFRMLIRVILVEQLQSEVGDGYIDFRVATL